MRRQEKNMLSSTVDRRFGGGVYVQTAISAVTTAAIHSHPSAALGTLFNPNNPPKGTA